MYDNASMCDHSFILKTYIYAYECVRVCVQCMRVLHVVLRSLIALHSSYIK